MLLQLNIKNFALIDNLSIAFDKGFNVFSGETGAGKSILVDAINYVIGGKFSKDFIRTGENGIFVEAVFSLENKNTIEILNQLDIEFDDLVILTRETFQSGKSIIKINGKSMIISNIKSVTETLLDIHGQHENQNLLSVHSHIVYLDNYGHIELKKELELYKIKYERLKELENKINELQGIEVDRAKLLDFFSFQIEEINRAGLKENEDIELEEKVQILANAEKISKTLSDTYNMLYTGSEDSLSIYDGIGLVLKELKGVENYYDKIKRISNYFEDVYFNFEQYVSDIRDINESINYSEEELDFTNSRIYIISSLKKKYGSTIKDILEYRNKISLQYDELVNSNELIESLKYEKSIVMDTLRKQSTKIHIIRLKLGNELERNIKSELNYVGLEKSSFAIDIVETNEFYVNGTDKVQFLISTNAGEPLKPLDKVISGGELSRIMLALKTVFIDNDKIPSIIFDEIDTGISGRIAQRVAEKMFIISNYHQVFCVTHLSQIASMADNNYLVNKITKVGKTYTRVEKLSEVEKINEVARMIGGFQVTELTLENSKELIKMANESKSKLYKNN